MKPGNLRHSKVPNPAKESKGQLLQIPFCSKSYLMNVINMARVVTIKTFEKTWPKLALTPCGAAT